MNNFLQKIQDNNLPVHVFGNGEVTHLVIGKVVRADGREHDAVCLIAQQPRPTSEDFLKKLASIACQCGKQKLETYPLCGLCFSNLTNTLKTALRRNKNAELEQTYNFAVSTLRGGRK